MKQDVPLIQDVAIDQIEILNPRTRSQKVHDEITASIRTAGLKRPIKVSRQDAKAHRPFGLICGQGRIEAYLALGQTKIPAIVVEANPERCLVESLVENIARRHHRGIDLMQEVGALKQRGLSDIEIAERIGVTPSWVNMITALLERGEEALVDAVESGVLPLSLAIQISRTDDAGAQAAMAEAYASGHLKGAKIGILRRLVARRSRSTLVSDTGFGRHTSKRLTGDDLVKLYQREMERQQLLVKKADFAQTQVAFVIAALAELRRDEGFQTILASESLLSLPKILADRMGQAA
jgi:ParB family chromosome partitioning protein